MKPKGLYAINSEFDGPVPCVAGSIDALEFDLDDGLGVDLKVLSTFLVRHEARLGGRVRAKS